MNRSNEPRTDFRPQPRAPETGWAAGVTRSILRGVGAAAVLIAACLAVAAAGPAHGVGDDALAKVVRDSAEGPRPAFPIGMENANFDPRLIASRRPVS